MSYNRPWKSYNDQLTLLKERGLIVTDDATAFNYLERIGYYRLSGYLYSFRELSEQCCSLPPKGSTNKKPYKKVTKLTLESFRQGSTFDQAVRLYIFDKKLRLLVLDALERI